MHMGWTNSNIIRMILVVVVIVILNGCAITISRSGLSKIPPMRQAPILLPAEVNTVSVDDNMICFWFFTKPYICTKAPLFVVEWIDPNNRTFLLDRIMPKPGDYGPIVSSLPIQNKVFSDRTGSWRVTLKHGGQTLDAKEFRMTNRLKSPDKSDNATSARAPMDDDVRLSESQRSNDLNRSQKTMKLIVGEGEGGGDAKEFRNLFEGVKVFVKAINVMKEIEFWAPPYPLKFKPEAGELMEIELRFVCEEATP